MGWTGYSLNLPVLGSSRPILLASWPDHQIEPSLPAMGSWGREPGVGSGHSMMLTSVAPESSTAGGRGFSGNDRIR